jgi:hypothetical protein
VHGLANATSDIDTICVVDGPDLSERTATQIFDQANHYETILFSRGEIARELRRLDALAGAPEAAQVNAYRTWDKGGPLTRKYLERLVNGVAADGSLPFFDRLPALAELWRAASFARALVMAECAALAQRAGESRGSLGYAANCCLYVMDAMLSHHGHVYSNKKWFLLRFERFLTNGGNRGETAALAQALHDVWRRTAALLADGSDANGIATEIAAVVTAAERVFAIDLRRHATWVPKEGTARAEFLPGAEMCLAGDVFIVAMPRTGAKPLPFGEGPRLEATTARALLRAARAGLLIPRFEPDGGAA